MQQLCIPFTFFCRGAHLDRFRGRGEANAHAKLTEENVRRIRAKPYPGSLRYCEKGVALALELGVSEKTIYLVRRRKLWAHIE